MTEAAIRTDRDRAIDELLDKQAIHEQLMLYCRGIDRADAELVKTVFHEDSHVHYGEFNGTGWEFADAIGTKVPVEFCIHLVGNELIVVEGDTAQLEAYYVAWAYWYPNGAGRHLHTMAGRYVDRWERRDDRVWRISKRVLVKDWSTFAPCEDTTAFPLDMSAFVNGRRDRTDIVYQRI
jgi:hypothetical protein